MIKTPNLFQLLQNCCCVLFFISIHNRLPAQLSIGGQPPGFQLNNITDSIPDIIMPPVNNDSLLLADSLQQNGQNGPFRYGFPIDVDFGIDNAGVWDTLSNGGRLWRVKISSLGAYSINLVYNEFYLPEGALFYVYNQERTHVLGGYTYINNNPVEKFATGLVNGDTIILELFEPVYASGQSKLNVSRIIHAYKNVGVEQGSPGASGSCNIGVNCPAGSLFCIEKRSVVLITNSNGALCSGALINNANNDLTSYILTANHCVDANKSGWISNDEEQAVNSWIFHFQYWDPDCDNVTAWATPIFGLVGGTLRAHNAFSDFALVELFNEPPPGMGAHYAGWDNSGNTPNSVVTIHHPAGDLMKISIDNTQPTIVNNPNTGDINTHWFVDDWDNGSTTGGSSGAPLFNQNARIVGQDHAGDGNSDCDPDKGTKYGRFDVSWDAGGTAASQLQNWLDPNNTGAQDMGPNATPVYLINRTITGLQNFTALNTLSLEGNVVIVPLNPQYVSCQQNVHPLITVSGSFIEFKSQNRVIMRKGVRLLAGSHVRVRTGAVNCLTDNLVNGDWINAFCFTDATPKKLPFTFDDKYWASNFGVQSDEVSNKPTEGDNYNKEKSQQIVQFYPNPNHGKFFLMVNKPKPGSALFIQDILSRNIFQSIINNSVTYIDISNTPPGIYFVKVLTGDKVFVQRLIIQ